MKIIMYGSPICSDCLAAEAEIRKHNNVELEYRIITKDVRTLKEFLAYRDHEPVFEKVRDRGYIGIPFFILEDGTKTFRISNYLG